VMDFIPGETTSLVLFFIGLFLPVQDADLRLSPRRAKASARERRMDRHP